MQAQGSTLQPWMAGKTCLVTGATGGIGRQTALALGRMGARVLAAGRSPDRVRSVVDELCALPGCAGAEGFCADLSLLAGARRLAAEVKERCACLDVLVNNAGAMFPTRMETREGLERTFALNHMSAFVLTHELLDLLKASAPARVVTVSSVAHVFFPLNFKNLQSRFLYNSWMAYSRSKLMNLYFTFELARRLEGSGVTANALHPGIVNSNFARQGLDPFILVMRLISPFSISVEEGAQTPIYLASSPDVEGVNGKYFVCCRQARPRNMALDAGTARRLWAASEELMNHA